MIHLADSRTSRLMVPFQETQERVMNNFPISTGYGSARTRQTRLFSGRAGLLAVPGWRSSAGEVATSETLPQPGQTLPAGYCNGSKSPSGILASKSRTNRVTVSPYLTLL
jgi:hypothetical protein